MRNNKTNLFKRLFVILFCISIFLNMSIVAASASGNIIGKAVYTDIVAKINGYDIASFNVSGKTEVVVEDLRNYGFDVKWDANSRTLSVARSNTNKVASTYVAPVISTELAGTKAYDIISSDIITYVNGYYVPSCNIGGKTVIDIQSLSGIGSIHWDAINRTISLAVPELDVIMYAPDGRTECTTLDSVDNWKQVGWYTVPVQYMYSIDGRTAVVEKRSLNQWKKNGWFDSSFITVYAPDGRAQTIDIKDAKAWIDVGWYTEPVCIMYSVANGNCSQINVAKSEVEKYRKTGWKTEAPKKYVKGYTYVTCSICGGKGYRYQTEYRGSSDYLKTTGSDTYIGGGEQLISYPFKSVKKQCNRCSGYGEIKTPVYYYYY